IFIRKSSYFTGHFRFDPTELDQILRMISWELEELRSEVRTLYSLDRIRPYHVLPFARRPLVFVGDAGFCMSVKLLADKATRGMYHVFMHPERTSERERARFQTYLGSAFTDYVEALFRRVFPASSGRYFGDEDLSRVVQGRRCDGLLDYGDSVVLIE